jgi:hypothetical protein
MLQHDIAAISLCAIDRLVSFQNALRGVDVAVGIHSTVTALDFHLQLTRLDLAISAIAESLKTGPRPFEIQLAPLYSTAVLGVLWVGSM